MKKIILAPLFAVLVFTGCVSQKPATTETTEPEAVSGNTAGEEPVKAAEKKLVEKTVTETLSLVAKETSYFSPGVMDGYTVYTYQAAPGTLLVKEETFDMDNKITESVEYQYADGRLQKVTARSADGTVKSVHQYGHDDQGRVITDGIYDAKNKLQTKSAYEYDNEGHKAKWSVYTGGETLQAYTVYSYEKDVLAVVDFFSAAGEKENYITYEYDGNGSMIRESFYTADGRLDKYTEYLYSGVHVVKESYYRGNKSLSRTVAYTLDEKGNTVKSEYANASGKIQEIKQYDYIFRDIEKKIQVYE